MPYICLARTDIPDGTVQILDLKPNSSNRNLIYEPEGQTKYVNRATNDPVLGTSTGITGVDANGLRAYIADRVDPTPVAVAWSDSSLALAANALLAEVDAGNGLTDAEINAALLGSVGAVGIGIAASTATGPEILTVLAGRGYLLPAGSQKVLGAAWSAVPAGAFTKDVKHFGTVWRAGEIRSSSIGGDTVAVETKPIKHTYNGTRFQVSLGAGHLLSFSSGITLFPDSDLVPHHEWAFQGASNFPEEGNARVVTVYNDDGSVLA